jgi:hypothetical protein
MYLFVQSFIHSFVDSSNRSFVQSFFFSFFFQNTARLDMLKTKAAERRDTIMSGITVAATTLGAGLADFLEDSERRSAFVVAISTAVLGIYTAKVTKHRLL